MLDMVMRFLSVQLLRVTVSTVQHAFLIAVRILFKEFLISQFRIPILMSQNKLNSWVNENDQINRFEMV